MSVALPARRRLRSPVGARALRSGRTRLGIASRRSSWWSRPSARSWRRTIPPRSWESHYRRPPATSRWAPTTSVTTCSLGCSGAVAASSGWRSRPPRSASGSVRRSACSPATAARASTTSLMRGMDVILAFPQIVLVLLFVSILGSNLALIVVLVALSWVPQVARVARGMTVGHRPPRIHQSAEAIGLSAPRILAREVLPNVTTPLMVEYGLRLTWSIAHDRSDQLPRLRDSAAERRLGPDDQREPERHHAPAWAVVVPGAVHRALRDRHELHRRGHLAGGRRSRPAGNER